MDTKVERVFHHVGLGDLSLIRAYVRETAVSQPATTTAIDELILAVNEAIENIIRHGYQDNPGDITIYVTNHNDSVQVKLLDNSLNFDPTTNSSPDMTLPLAERPIGGMGVHMMRVFCDEVTYRRTDHGENELTLLKRIDLGDEN